MILYLQFLNVFIRGAVKLMKKIYGALKILNANFKPQLKKLCINELPFFNMYKNKIFNLIDKKT